MRNRTNTYHGYDDLTEEEIERNIERKRKLIRQIKIDLAVKAICFAVILFVSFGVVFGISTAPTNDMYPAVHQGDLLIFFRLGRLTDKEIVLYETEDGPAIGRIQACDGEKIDRTEGGKLTINGNIQPVQERSGLYYETYVEDDTPLPLPSVLKEDSFLILGDDRLYSKDSREYGLIPGKDIKGKVFTIIRRRPL